MSRAAKSFGVELIGTYVSLYFDELGGSSITLELMTAMTYMIGCVTFPLGSFIADYYGRRRITFLTAFYGAFFPTLCAVMQDACIFPFFP